MVEPSGGHGQCKFPTTLAPGIPRFWGKRGRSAAVIGARSAGAGRGSLARLYERRLAGGWDGSCKSKRGRLCQRGRDEKGENERRQEREGEMVIGGGRETARRSSSKGRRERARERPKRRTEESKAKSRAAVFSSSGGARKFTTVRRQKQRRTESLQANADAGGGRCSRWARRVSTRGASESVTEHQQQQHSSSTSTAPGTRSLGLPLATDSLSNTY